MDSAVREESARIQATDAISDFELMIRAELEALGYDPYNRADIEKFWNQKLNTKGTK